MKGWKFIYTDNVTIFVEHDDLYDGTWDNNENIIIIYKNFDFYEK